MRLPPNQHCIGIPPLSGDNQPCGVGAFRSAVGSFEVVDAVAPSVAVASHVHASDKRQMCPATPATPSPSNVAAISKRPSCHSGSGVSRCSVLHRHAFVCRYDVKYGSAGFNAYGYKGGCAFANGTAEQALADPAAAQYLCPAAQEDTVGCVYDSSGVGECTGRTRLDGFFRFEEVRGPRRCAGMHAATGHLTHAHMHKPFALAMPEFPLSLQQPGCACSTPKSPPTCID